MRNIFVVLLLTVLSAISFGQKLPTRKQVEEAGIRPYLRYTVPIGELKSVSNSIFSQPAFDTPEGKVKVETSLRGVAENLGLTGELAWDEFPGSGAPQITIEKKAVVVYERRNGIVYPLYLADCRYKGKPYFNRLKLVKEPAEAPIQMAAVPTPAPRPEPQVVAQQGPPPAPSANNFNFPPFPNNLNVNLAGLPQYQPFPQIPSNITVHNINENVNRKVNDWSEKFANVGKGVGWVGFGTGAAAFGILFPGAYENASYANRDGMIGAAKGRVPDVMNISASANPTVNSNPTATSNPTVTANPSNTANGGNGGNGGQGGAGGSGGGGGSGGSPSAIASATGGPAGNNGPIKININNDNKNINNNDNTNVVKTPVDVDVNVVNHPPNKPWKDGGKDDYHGKGGGKN